MKAMRFLLVLALLALPFPASAQVAVMGAGQVSQSPGEDMSELIHVAQAFLTRWGAGALTDTPLTAMPPVAIQGRRYPMADVRLILPFSGLTVIRGASGSRVRVASLTVEPRGGKRRTTSAILALTRQPASWLVSVEVR